MSKISQILIIGGGQSLKNVSKPLLQSVLDTNCSILTNYAYRHFRGTFLTCIDRNFYKTNDLKTNPDIYDELKSLPLIVGVDHNNWASIKHENTILVPKKKYHIGDLTGIFSLSIAVELLEHIGEIFLLGFDWTRRKEEDIDKTKYSSTSNVETHFYSDLKHRGSGYVGYYENHNPDKMFERYLKEKDVKVFNVSLESNINCFEKISFETMFSLLKNTALNQNELRNKIKSII